MNKLFQRIIAYMFFLQCSRIIHTFELQEELLELMGKSKSAHWPLQAGYSGLSIKNLDEYVSLFSHCLVNIQNYQGIEIIGIKSPVYITRFDVALVPCSNLKMLMLDYDITR